MRSNRNVTRGVNFLIPVKDAQAFVEESKVFVQSYNKIMIPLFNFYQHLIREYPNAKIGEFGTYIHTDEDEITGLDGNKYELAEHVVNRSNSSNNRKWFKKSKQLPTDEIDTTSGKKITDTQFKDMIHNLFPEMENSYITDVVAYCTNRLTSRIRQRTKTKKLNDVLLSKKRPPLLRNLTIHSKKGRFKLKDGMVLYKTHNNKVISAPYITKEPLDNVVNLDILFNKNKGKGGNFKVTQKKRHKYHRFIVQCTKIQSFDYIPESWVGMDINVARLFWLVFWDLATDLPFTWSRGDYPQNLIDQRAELTKLIDDKKKGGCNARQRSRLRKLRFTVDRQQKKYIRRIFTPLLEKLREENKGLAIDMVGWGASSGNNGMQESITKVVPILCYELGVVYSGPGAAFTTRDCSQCLHRHTKKEKDAMIKAETFVCKSCGHTLPIHQDAARVTAVKAEKNHKLTFDMEPALV